MSTESFVAAVGRKVVSRATARELGSVAHLLVTPDCRQVAAVIIGKGKKAHVVDWLQVTGFGADAVMVSDESALRPPRDDRERAGAGGQLELLMKRTLSELGHEHGPVDDVTFDPVLGTIETLQIGGRPVHADEVLGAGSYAVILAAGRSGPPA